MIIFKKKIIIVKILNCLAGSILIGYCLYRFSTKQYEFTDNVVDFAVSMHYDFKVLNVNEDSYFNYIGMTREGKKVNFKLPKIWNLRNVCSVGDSICKVAGDSSLYVIKQKKRILVKMEKQ